MSSLKNRLTRRFKGSLSARIITLVLALLLVLQVASFWSIRASLQHNARQTLPAQLATADRVLTDMLGHQTKSLAESLRVLATDYGFGEALATNDEATIADMLDNHGKRISATEVMMIGTDLQLVAYSGSRQRPLAALLPALAPA